MSENILQYRGVVAVCFSCGTEKTRVFSSCTNCAEQPMQEDELLDSMLLSRYCSSESLLSRAAAERSPGLVIKTANRTTMRSLTKTLRDPQLRQLLGLEATRSRSSATQSNSEQLLESMTLAAKKELGGQANISLLSAPDKQSQLSVWALNERSLQALHNEADSVSSEVLLESVCELAERCHAIEASEVQSYLHMLTLGEDIDGDEQRQTWNMYQQSLLDRLVVSLERVKTSNLLDLFVRLEITAERRRDHKALPLIKSLLDIYKLNALEALRLEGDNAHRLMSVIRSNSADEHNLSHNMLSSLEALVGNWSQLAKPLGGVIADRDVASIRREIQSELEKIADHLANKKQEPELSARASRLALELL